MADWDVTVEMNVGGVSTYNTFQMSDAGGGGPFDPQAERVRDLWEDHIMTRLSSDAQLVNVRCIDRDTGDENNASSTQTGTLGPNALSVNSGVQYTKVTASGRNGRMFIAGHPEASVDADGRISGAVQDDNSTAFQTFLDELVLVGLQMFVISDAPLAFPRNVTSANCPAFIVRQGRRLKRARSF